MPAPNPTSIDPTRFQTKHRVPMTVHGTNFAQVGHVRVTLLETHEKTVTWDEHPPIETSTGTKLTFHATPQGHATHGAGRLNVTVENDEYGSSGSNTFDLEFCKSPATTVKIGEIDPFRPQIALAHLGHRSI